MPIPRQLIIDDQPYDLLEVGPNRRHWDQRMVSSQPGDGSQPKPIAIEWHGGFGATHRHSSSRGPSDPTHHDYAENVDATVRGFLAPSPRITYIDLSTLTATNKAFVLGGSKRSRLGGSTTAALGGGSYVDSPWAITEFGDFLYIHAGTHTYVVEPATPSHVETRVHGVAARARSGDVFDNVLVVALGSNVDAEVATIPYSSAADQSVWAAASGVQVSVYRVGGGGRLFAAQDNLVFNVLPGQDPANSNNYLPTSGEVITDKTRPIRSLVEFARGLVAGTARTARTLDPEAGYVSRALLPDNRLSPSDFDGRALLNTGDFLLYATTRVVWMITTDGRKVRAGPELMEANQSPYIGGEPGIPDIGGDWIFWPYFFSTSGDSVIFKVRLREPDEPGTGPLIWQDWLWLENVECRVVRYWGGDASTKPRLFFGGATTSNPERVGYVDLGRGGGPDVFDTDAQPALTGFIRGAHDDLGLPGVVRDVERLELPLVLNADANNYSAWAVSDDNGVSFKDLHLAQSGSNQERVVGTGFQQVFAQTASLPSGRELIVRGTFTQASGATTFVSIHGVPQLYVSERPAQVRQVQTILSVDGIPNQEDAEAMVTRIEALSGGAKVEIRHQPGDTTAFAKIFDVHSVEVEVESPSGRRETEWAVGLTYREVATA